MRESPGRRGGRALPQKSPYGTKKKKLWGERKEFPTNRARLGDSIRREKRKTGSRLRGGRPEKGKKNARPRRVARLLQTMAKGKKMTLYFVKKTD